MLPVVCARQLVAVLSGLAVPFLEARGASRAECGAVSGEAMRIPSACASGFLAAELAWRYRSPRRFSNAERIGHDFAACWHGPVTLEKRGIATALLTAFRKICELRPYESDPFRRHAGGEGGSLTRRTVVMYSSHDENQRFFIQGPLPSAPRRGQPNRRRTRHPQTRSTGGTSGAGSRR